MSTEISTKTYIPLAVAAKALPGSPHISTLHRWRTRGINGVRLITKKIGARRVVESAEIERFIEAVTCAADGQPKPVRTSRQRQKAIEAAERELAAEGIGRSLDKCKVQGNGQSDQAHNPTNGKSK